MRRAGAAVLLAAGLVLAGCGNGDDSPEGEPTPGPSTTATATATATATEEPTTAEDPEGELPGEAVEIYPYEGGGLGVIGVAVDDVLNVREGPGTEFDTIAELGPLTTDIVATGHNRRLEDGSLWSEIEVDGPAGWASTAFLAYPGDTTDITSELEELPSAPTLEEAGELVAQERAGDQPPSATAVVVNGPTEGDPAEIIVDVTEYGDDALGGERLHVFAVEEGDGYTVQTVEATLLCIRGLSDGLCV